MVFSRQFFPAPGSKNVLSYYSYCTIFLKKKSFDFIVNAKKENKLDHGEKKIEGSAETPGGAAETVEKPKLNYSCEAEEKINVRKTN